MCKWLRVNRIIRIRGKYLKPFNCVQKKTISISFKNVIKKNVFTNHIWHQITYNVWYSIKPNQTNSTSFIFSVWFQLINPSPGSCVTHISFVSRIKFLSFIIIILCMRSNSTKDAICVCVCVCAQQGNSKSSYIIANVAYIIFIPLGIYNFSNFLTRDFLRGTGDHEFDYIYGYVYQSHIIQSPNPRTVSGLV